VAFPSVPFQSRASEPARPARLRRSCLAVPGSNPKMMERAATSEADQIFLDLEDAVAPNEKKGARAKVVDALNSNDYSGKTVVVRVNDATTRYMYDDIIELVRGAAAQLDCLMIPKVQNPGQLWFVENLLNQLEIDLELDQRLGLEVQIETGTGSVTMTEIAHVTDRIETLIFGPGDYAANMGVPQLDLGMIEPNYPGHQWHYIIAQIVNNARAVGADAIDGPYGDYGDPDGYRESCRRAALLGMDGKWCIHPSQIPIANEVFAPSKEQFDLAERMLAAYAEAIEQGRGAASLDGKMIDEASRKMAEKLVLKGRAAGLG
jgi:citrate lyase subunit beta / citryl-CoA lyase